jgi:hypothetical protein
MSKLTKPLWGAANGEIYPREYAAGEDCPPELEDAAREIDALADAPDAAAVQAEAEAKAKAEAEEKSAAEEAARLDAEAKAKAEAEAKAKPKK